MVKDLYAQAVGRWLAQARKEYGLTLDQVAQVARRHGGTWSASSVRNLEAGQASLTLANLLLLGVTFSELTSTPLRLADLLGEAETFDLPTAINDNGPTPRAWVNAALSGAPLIIGERRIAADEDYQDFPTDLPMPPRTVIPQEADTSAEDATSDSRSDRKTHAATNNGHASVDAQWDQLNDPERGKEERSCDPVDPEVLAPFRAEPALPTLAETRAADRLGITPELLIATARELWGHSLDEESAHRAGPGATPQARGRVTRTLMEEVRQALE